MIQIYNNKHLTWDGTTSINHYELFADTVTDLPSDPYYFSSPDKGSYKMAQGAIEKAVRIFGADCVDDRGLGCCCGVAVCSVVHAPAVTDDKYYRSHG